MCFVLFLSGASCPGLAGTSRTTYCRYAACFRAAVAAPASDSLTPASFDFEIKLYHARRSKRARITPAATWQRSLRVLQGAEACRPQGAATVVEDNAIPAPRHTCAHEGSPQHTPTAALHAAARCDPRGSATRCHAASVAAGGAWGSPQRHVVEVDQLEGHPEEALADEDGEELLFGVVPRGVQVGGAFAQHMDGAAQAASQAKASKLETIREGRLTASA